MNRNTNIEILSTKHSVEWLSFTVDTSGTQVPTDPQGDPIIFESGNLFSSFKKHEAWTITGLYMVMPYCFTISTDIPQIQLAFLSSDNTAYGFNNSNSTSWFNVPVQNVFIPLDFFYNGNGIGNDIGFGGVIGPDVQKICIYNHRRININMIGVPDSLNGTSQKIDFCIIMNKYFSMDS